MSEDPKQPLIAPPPYPSAPPPAYAPPSSSTHTTVITTPPVITATTALVIRPRTYLVWSILSLIWCPLLGIFALMFSLKVDSEWNAGRYGEAYNASRMARLLNLIGLICHIVVVTTIVVVVSVNTA